MTTTPTTTDELVAFTKAYLATCGPVPPSIFAGVNFVDKDFAQLTLIRDGQFQVQLCLCRPGAEIVDHKHPTVDTVVIFVTGQIDFRVDGKPIFQPGEVYETADGRCSKNMRMLRIGPGVSHGATMGPAGGAFMTIQRWLDGKPRSVELDWEGPNLSKEHARKRKKKP